MFNNITHHLTQPYIDEIFHLRQCQTYCQYNFHHWDNKITTPPGLYILGFIYSEGIKILTRSSSTGGGGGGGAGGVADKCFLFSAKESKWLSLVW